MTSNGARLLAALQIVVQCQPHCRRIFTRPLNAMVFAQSRQSSCEIVHLWWARTGAGERSAAACILHCTQSYRCNYDQQQARVVDSRGRDELRCACAESETPYICLGDFLEQLIEIGWAHGDVQAVRAAVLPMLGELKSGDTVRLGTAKLSVSGQSSENKGVGKALERK